MHQNVVIETTAKKDQWRQIKFSSKMRKYEEFKKDIHSVGRVGAEQTQGDFRSIFLFSKYSNRRLSPYSFKWNQESLWI